MHQHTEYASEGRLGVRRHAQVPIYGITGRTYRLAARGVAPTSRGPGQHNGLHPAMKVRTPSRRRTSESGKHSSQSHWHTRQNSADSGAAQGVATTSEHPLASQQADPRGGSDSECIVTRRSDTVPPASSCVAPFSSLFPVTASA